jgi:hypothetical protein
MNIENIIWNLKIDLGCFPTRNKGQVDTNANDEFWVEIKIEFVTIITDNVQLFRKIQNIEIKFKLTICVLGLEMKIKVLPFCPIIQWKKMISH